MIRPFCPMLSAAFCTRLIETPAGSVAGPLRWGRSRPNDLELDGLFLQFRTKQVGNWRKWNFRQNLTRLASAGRAKCRNSRTIRSSRLISSLMTRASSASGEPRGQPLLLREQPRLDGCQRITDFVGDARRQHTQGGQLLLALEQAWLSMSLTRSGAIMPLINDHATQPPSPRRRMSNPKIDCCITGSDFASW